MTEQLKQEIETLTDELDVEINELVFKYESLPAPETTATRWMGNNLMLQIKDVQEKFQAAEHKQFMDERRTILRRLKVVLPMLVKDLEDYEEHVVWQRLMGEKI